MVLIKKNEDKHRSVFFDGTYYIKVWSDAKPSWISEHVNILNELVPGYVVEHGGNWIKFNPIKGKSANEFDHTDDFIKQIYNFCLDNIEKTKPYAHGDWVLSNIIIDNQSIQMCDWDNVGIYTSEEILKKLKDDLYSAFGEKFLKVIHDSASI